MRVMVNPGDTIARDQPVLELETDKATIEVPSTVAGTVKEVRVKKGDKVTVGAVVFTVDEGASGGNGASGQKAKAEEKPAAPPQKPDAPAAAESKPAAETRPDHKVISMPARGAQEPPPPSPAPSNPASAFAQGASADKKAGLHDDRGPVAPASPAVRRLAREVGVNV